MNLDLNVMELNRRVEKVHDYFQFMNVNKEVYYVLVAFPKKWVVPSETSDIVKIMKAETNPDSYYFYTDFSNGYGVLFNTIDEIIRQNKEIEEKFKLFNAKLGELKTLFENEDLSVLENMKFNITVSKDDLPVTECGPKEEETELIKEEVLEPSPLMENGEPAEPLRAKQEETEEPNEVVVEEPVEEKVSKKTKSKNKKNNIGLSVMDAAKKLVK